MEILLDNSAFSLMSCKRKFQLAVVEGLYSSKSNAAAFGDAVHKGIEFMHTGSDLESAINKASKCQPGADAMLLRQTLTFFALSVRIPPPVMLNGLPAVEVKWRRHWGSIINSQHKKVEIYLAGTIDNIHLDDGTLVFLDYKTAGSYTDTQIKSKMEDYELTFQLPFYVYNSLESGILPAEYVELIKQRRYRTEIMFIFFNAKPPVFKRQVHSAFNDEFLYNEVPSIINAKVSEAMRILELTAPAPHDGMTVYKACTFCEFRPACLSMGTEREIEFLNRFDRRDYNPLTFR